MITKKYILSRLNGLLNKAIREQAVKIASSLIEDQGDADQKGPLKAGEGPKDSEEDEDEKDKKYLQKEGHIVRAFKHGGLTHSSTHEKEKDAVSAFTNHKKNNPDHYVYHHSDGKVVRRHKPKA